MAWRVARSLLTLRDQINDRYPNRNKASDGTIGDADHRNRNSDHNPWYGPGIVTALDITHDPGAGVDIDRLTDELQSSRDRRIKYVIANDLIMSGAGGPSPWVWREYEGTNLHTSHFHLSVVASPLCDDTSPWNLPSLRTGGGGAAPGQEDLDMDRRTFEQYVHNGVLQALRNPDVRKEIIDAVWVDRKVSRGGKDIPAIQELADAKTEAIAIQGKVAGLAEAHRQDQAGEARDLDAVRQAAEDGTRTALAEGTVTVDIDVTGPEGSAA